MSLTIEAVYENGVLRPLSPLALKENERVTLTVDSAAPLGVPAPASTLDFDVVEHARRVLAEIGPAPRLEEVHRRLRKIRESMSAEIAEEPSKGY